MSKTIVRFLPPEEVGEDQAGWWILHLDHDGEDGCYDAAGPYDTQAEAERLAEPWLNPKEDAHQ